MKYNKNPLSDIFNMNIRSILLVGVLVLFGCNSNKNCAVGPGTPGAICTMEYNPVCGCDGITYGNACFAAAQGISETTPGECN